MLEVERHKTPEASTPETLEVSVGEAGSRFIDPKALAETMGTSGGTELLTQDRRERIERSLEVLDHFLADEKIPIAILVHDESSPLHWLEGSADYELKKATDACLAAMSLFDHKSAELSEVFRAVRVAELELSQSYDANLHDPWFAAFNWETFSKEELLLLPAVVAIDKADHVAGKGLLSFSRLLRSGRPVQVLVDVVAGQNPGAEPGEDPLASYRFELGYLAMSHRESFVSQSSIARPNHLIEGFVKALDTLRSGVHILNTSPIASDNEPKLAPYLQAGAAIEGRAHPFFRYNPEAGDSWAQCADFSENPAPAEDWPTHPLAYREGGAEGEKQTTDAAFTYVDFALLCPAMQEHFRVVPDVLEIADLIPVEAYLKLSPSKGFKHLPFIWGENEGRLRRLVVSRELVLSCRDRLGYWRTLQAVAGTRDEYAITAAEQARQEALAQATKEREELEAAHQQELDKAREETAGEAMQRLTEVLLGLDLTQVTSPAMAVSTTSAAPAPSEAPPQEAAPEAAAVEEEEDEVSFDQPYIDSMLCTSCNDCMKINALTFVYNENKQAMIGDAKAATFEQLVVAAEKCPARCIHPGKPLNPDEPNLDELIERAKPFN
jgi:ferredoxin